MSREVPEPRPGPHGPTRPREARAARRRAGGATRSIDEDRRADRRGVEHRLEFLVAETDASGVRRERVVVNEIAPRVHNSGHWTIDGAETSQFEQHVRAIAGWPLGSPRRRGQVEMRNLIGEQADQWAALAAEPGACLHLYGKAEARPGRKMGHVTRVKP